MVLHTQKQLSSLQLTMKFVRICQQLLVFPNTHSVTLNLNNNNGIFYSAVQHERAAKIILHQERTQISILKNIHKYSEMNINQNRQSIKNCNTLTPSPIHKQTDKEI